MEGGYRESKLNLRHEYIYYWNVNQVFEKHGVPHEFDVLSIDLDWADYFVWKHLDDRKYRPRVVVLEVNGLIPFGENKVRLFGCWVFGGLVFFSRFFWMGFGPWSTVFGFFVVCMLRSHAAYV